MVMTHKQLENVEKKFSQSEHENRMKGLSGGQQTRFQVKCFSKWEHMQSTSVAQCLWGGGDGMTPVSEKCVSCILKKHAPLSITVTTQLQITRQTHARLEPLFIASSSDSERRVGDKRLIRPKDWPCYKYLCVRPPLQRISPSWLVHILSSAQYYYNSQRHLGFLWSLFLVS